MTTCHFRSRARAAAFVAIGLLAALLGARSFSSELRYNLSGELQLVTNSSAQAPMILGQPRAQVAPVGATVIFSVSAVASPPPTFQWQFNSNNIPGATADTLLLSNLRPNEFGAYRAMVSNPSGSVTSSNALLQLDSDRDGMADAWETNYFASITNRSGVEDYDQDGASDREEFLEGTHPRIGSTSVNPRLTIISDYGEVFVTPYVSFFTNGQTVTLTGTPRPGLQFITYLGTPTGGGPYYMLRTNPAQMRFGFAGMSGSQTVRAVFGLPVLESIEVTNAWRLDGPGWFGQSQITHDGVDAMQTSRMLGAPAATLELSDITLTNEGTITFWWKVDGTPANRLRFFRNFRLRSGEIGTNTDWQKRTYYLEKGVNLVRWTYSSSSDEVSEYNGLFEAPADAAWVDEVSYAVWPDPALDADSDGMRDIWELRYFDTTGLAPNADEDRDGISNLDEYLDGTDPTSNASFLPRLTVLATGGTVTRNPDKPKYTLNDNVLLQAMPDPDNYFVVWSGALSGTNTTNSIRMNGNKTVSAIFGLPLAIALDTPTWQWTRTEAIGFFGQTNVSSDGVDAAQAGPVAIREVSAMETSVAGPGTLIFWWKAQCSTNVNFGKFFVDGVEQPEKITGAMDWQPYSALLPAGSHTLRWIYTNNSAVVTLTNTVWVDRVTFSSSTVPPEIATQPGDLLLAEGGDGTLRVRASGTPPLRYQWFRNGVSLGAAGTNSTLTLNDVSLGQAGAYSVEVSNAAQVISSRSANVTVLPTPPPNDDFGARASLTGTNNLLGYNSGATWEVNEPSHASVNGLRSVWWAWTAPADGPYRLNIAATNPPANFGAAIYTGTALTNLAEIASGLATPVTNSNPSLSRVSLPFNGTAGTLYSIAVDATGSGVFFTLGISAGAAERPALLSTVITGDEIAFNLAAPPGANYVIEASHDLQSWVVIATGAVPPSGVLNFSDAISAANAARFYRIRIL
jgi:hypothetical protein